MSTVFVYGVIRFDERAHCEAVVFRFGRLSTRMRAGMYVYVMRVSWLCDGEDDDDDDGVRVYWEGCMIWWGVQWTGHSFNASGLRARSASLRQELPRSLHRAL